MNYNHTIQRYRVFYNFVIEHSIGTRRSEFVDKPNRQKLSHLRHNFKIFLYFTIISLTSTILTLGTRKLRTTLSK